MVIYSTEARFWDKTQLPWRKITVPAPYDTDTPGLDTWWNRWARQALDLRRTGFTMLATPPVLKTQSGSFDTGDGYGWNGDLDDIGTKNWSGSLPTRFGLGQELLRMVGNLNAVGVQTMTNIVTHQAAGGRNGVYRFPNWKGVQGAGHTKWDQGCFRDYQGEDPVWEQPDFGFANEFVFARSNPPGYTQAQMIAGWQRLKQRIGWSWARMDDVKGEYLPFVRDFIKANILKDGRYVGEDFDGNAPLLDAYLDAMGNPGNFSLFDFDLHWGLQQILSQTYGNFRQMNGRGLAAGRPYQAVTFVENADTDLTDGQQVIGNKRLCYAYLLTVEGAPQVYHKDYATDQDCYGLKEYIDPMIWCHEMLADGGTRTLNDVNRDPGVIVLDRFGSPGMVSAFSNDPIFAQTRTVNSHFPEGMWLHDYSGQHDDIKVGKFGQIRFTIPSNRFGAGNSYLMFGPADFQGEKIAANPTTTTQHVFGADDRDVAPALANGITTVWPFWCSAQSNLSLKAAAKYPGVTFRVAQPGGAVLNLDSAFKVSKTGWHTIQAVNQNSADVPYEVAVTYMGSQTLSDADVKMPIPALNTFTPVR